MDYIHPNLQVKSKEIAKKIAIASISRDGVALFCCILGIKDIAEYLAQYLRYIDYLSLKRSSKHLPLNILNKLYTLDSLVDIKLKGKNLFDVADKAKCVVSGSFILRILLSTPYQMPVWIDCVRDFHNNRWWKKSDIDIYSRPLKTDYCPSCYRNMVDSSISSVSPYLCNGQVWSEYYRQKGTPNNYFHSYNNTLEDIVDCHNCHIDNINFNDIIISHRRNIVDFIKEAFDFDFCKNYYRKGKLYISHPETVLKMNCIFQLKPPENIDDIYDVCGTTQYGKVINRDAKLYKTLYERYPKYTNRGFHITFQITKQYKLMLTQSYKETVIGYSPEANHILNIINKATVIT